ncbi:MAG: hypothetical protein HQK75_16125 [Candidatus Magnetomorum sp.]|nr:hypothetical protein [Candidatus Magnetomorum sp.]
MRKENDSGIDQSLIDEEIDPQQQDIYANTVKALAELEKTINGIQAEVDLLRINKENLSCEIDGIHMSIASAEAFIHAYEERKNAFVDRIETTTEKKERLIEDVNRLHLKLKAVKDDQQSTSALENSLLRDLHDIVEEKNIIRKRMVDIQKGLERISLEQQNRLPSIYKCNDILKKLNTSLKKALNDMEISLIFSAETYPIR